MPNKTITAEVKETNALNNVLDRETEIESYQVNIDNYVTILAGLPSVWTPELEQYKGLDSQGVASNVPLEHVDLVSDLLFYDRVSFLLRTEVIEQRKAKHIYNAIVSQMNPTGLSDKLKTARVVKTNKDNEV